MMITIRNHKSKCGIIITLFQNIVAMTRNWHNQNQILLSNQNKITYGASNEGSGGQLFVQCILGTLPEWPPRQFIVKTSIFSFLYGGNCLKVINTAYDQSDKRFI